MPAATWSVAVTGADSPPMARLSYRQFFKEAPLERRLAMIGVGALAVLVTSSSAFSIKLILRATRAEMPKPVAAAPRKPAALQEMPPYTFRFELANFSISLPSAPNGRTSYAQFSLVLDCPNLEARRHMELNRARLRDTVLSASLPFSVAELQDSKGISRYKTKLMAELKTTFGANAPRDLSLENFLVH
jgi:flagellar basal body-associated protein FliL